MSLVARLPVAAVLPVLLAAAALLSSGCGRCGSYLIETVDGNMAEAIEECGPLSGSFAEASSGNTVLTLVPASTNRDADDMLVAMSPELILTLSNEHLAAGTTTQAADLYGTASVFLDSSGSRVVANLADGYLTVNAPVGTSLIGEPRWRMTWYLVFESDELRVEAEGGDKIDIVADNSESL